VVAVRLGGEKEKRNGIAIEVFGKERRKMEND
jgi:hypothetical protein